MDVIIGWVRYQAGGQQAHSEGTRVATNSLAGAAAAEQRGPRLDVTNVEHLHLHLVNYDLCGGASGVAILDAARNFN